MRINGDTLSEKKVTVQVLDEIERPIQRYLPVQIATSALLCVVAWEVFAWMGDDTRKTHFGTTQDATTELGSKAAEGAGVGWGIPEERVQRYEAGIKKGGILMGVRSRSDDDAQFFADNWKKNRAADVYA